jgi:hypothetical protein
MAQGADLAADGCGRTALLVACAHGHKAAAAMFVEPTKTAGALDVCSSAFTGLVEYEASESGGIVLVAHAGVRAPRTGVTRQGVVLTDLKSLLDCQLTSLSPPRCMVLQYGQIM